MRTYIENLGNMFGAWNTTDEKEQARLAEAALEHNVHFVDPNHNIVGRGAFLEMVRATQTKFPGLRYGPSCEPQIQNNFCRYHWAIHSGEKQVMTGFDVTEVTDAGKIMKVIGFFGELERNMSAPVS
ncbi:nuclear transport factor 2 family protein [Erythrobacter sp. Alg231-14]|uniref:nuclear transport factor 2 family protein n=1 Tax=Erythrobacter sp. Alg231-14 TaxID=1922225 RepID=UPI00307C442B